MNRRNVLVFYVDYDPRCHSLQDTLREVISHGNFGLYSINAKHFPDAVRNLHIRSYPVVFIVQRQGLLTLYTGPLTTHAIFRALETSS